MRAGTLALLALVCAGLAHVGPTSAYEHAAIARDTSAAIVTQSNGYNAVGAQSSCNQGLGTRECTITITNKGTGTITYTVSEDPDNTFVNRYRIDASSWATSGRVTSPSATSVGGTSTLTIEIPSCTIGCSTRTAYYTLEGEKAGSLSSMQTKIKIQMN